MRCHLLVRLGIEAALQQLEPLPATWLLRALLGWPAKDLCWGPPCSPDLGCVVRCLLDAGEVNDQARFSMAFAGPCQAIYAILRLAQGSSPQLHRDPQLARALALGLAASKPVASVPPRAASSDLVERALAQGKAHRTKAFACPARWMRCSTA